jgi:hypothetical protein
MAEHMRAGLVIDAARMAHAAGRVEGNAIFHSARGSQYTSKEFRDELTRPDMRQSTGRTGSCFDNAAAESLFAVLKSEIGVRERASRALARSQVFRWIAGYYVTEFERTSRGGATCGLDASHTAAGENLGAYVAQTVVDGWRPLDSPRLTRVARSAHRSAFPLVDNAPASRRRARSGVTPSNCDGLVSVCDPR